MSIEQFMKSIYLGDRFLKEIVIDSYNKEIKLKIRESMIRLGVKEMCLEDARAKQRIYD